MRGDMNDKNQSDADLGAWRKSQTIHPSSGSSSPIAGQAAWLREVSSQAAELNRTQVIDTLGALVSASQASQASLTGTSPSFVASRHAPTTRGGQWRARRLGQALAAELGRAP